VTLLPLEQIAASRGSQPLGIAGLFVMKLVALPAFADNYIWMIRDGLSAVVIDPGDWAPVLEALASQHLALAGILVTRHHGDHVGGLQGLPSFLKGLACEPGAIDSACAPRGPKRLGRRRPADAAATEKQH
jgi:glyoxylase-like metal-dependent hydrolase (beta-lactamase superfamily II)